MFMHYRQIWEQANNKTIPDGYEIHHIDGNRSNNDPSNLMCVSIEDHLQIHLKQEDWGAVQAILARKNTDKTLISFAASKAQTKRWKEGTHNWQIHESKRKARAKETLDKRIKETGNAFSGIKDRSANAKNARLKMSRDMELKLQSQMVDKVRGTKWWTNTITGISVRSIECPGEQWKRGMKK